MSIADKVAALSSSVHTGRALRAAKVLNLIGTVRGAVTTVLLASSAIGGAVTVNNVRQDIIKDQSAATVPPARVASPRTTAPSVATPVTAAGLRADAQRRLQDGLDQAAQAADDLRRVSILTVAGTEALVTQTRQKLQARFDQAMTQVDALLAPPPSAAPAVGWARNFTNPISSWYWRQVSDNGHSSESRMYGGMRISAIVSRTTRGSRCVGDGG